MLFQAYTHKIKEFQSSDLVSDACDEALDIQLSGTALLAGGIGALETPSRLL